MFQFIYGWIFSSSTSFIQDGYSTISFIGLYLLARYLKIYKPKFIKFRIEIDFIIVFGLILLVTALYLLSPEVGHRFLSYISPTTLLITMFTVVAFNKFRLNSKFINWYAASSFAVFLFHTNPNVIWHYVSVCEKLHNILYPLEYWGVICLLLFLIFIIATLIDQIRLWLWKYIWPTIESKLK